MLSAGTAGSDAKSPSSPHPAEGTEDGAKLVARLSIILPMFVKCFSVKAATKFPVSAIAIVLFINNGQADPIYKTVGDSVILNPGQFLDPISSVTWKQEPDLALDWEGPDVICYRDFKNRCSLNKKDGSLTINNLKVEDSGIYTPQINHKILKKLELQVIKPVPKPTVSVKCNNEKTRCNLTCEANISPDVGTVTYKWRNEEVVLSNDKDLIITTEDKESSFICELENPVSSSSSDGVDNPISRGNHVAKAVIVLLTGGAAVVLILVGCVVCCSCETKDKASPSKKEKTDDQNKESAEDPSSVNHRDSSTVEQTTKESEI